MEVSFFIFRILIITTEVSTSLEKKIHYEVPQGYLIKDLLRNEISEYDCYYCTIILFINDKKRKRVGAFGPCEILDPGRNSCRFDSCKHCRSDWNIYYI